MITKEDLEVIHQSQLQTIVPYKELNTYLASKQRGLYWIWTDYTFAELATMAYEPIPKSRHVNIRLLVNQRKMLDYVCKQQVGNRIVLYNGIGGYRNSIKPAFGLRERIRQEFNCNDPRTGTLNLANTNLDIERFYVSFFNFDEVAHKNLISWLQDAAAYTLYASDVEKLWRLHYGHPILCRH